MVTGAEAIIRRDGFCFKTSGWNAVSANSPLPENIWNVDYFQSRNDFEADEV